MRVSFEKDSISFFKLKSDDFLTIGRRISELQRPTLFVMEGGYDIEELGSTPSMSCKGLRGRLVRLLELVFSICNFIAQIYYFRPALYCIVRV